MKIFCLGGGGGGSLTYLRKLKLTDALMGHKYYLKVTIAVAVG